MKCPQINKTTKKKLVSCKKRAASIVFGNVVQEYPHVMKSHIRVHDCVVLSLRISTYGNITISAKH